MTTAKHIINLTRNQWLRIVGHAIREQVRASTRVRNGLRKRGENPAAITTALADYERERDLLGELCRSDEVIISRT